ncbi:MAG TPA: phosphoribosylformylglycinamidine cyclo-ligase, partial [Coxiellaceae bacterium]|nr:phosphoribosylformylglycinamidine cyclo-ligase [Coxiellaceae bacterium]
CVNDVLTQGAEPLFFLDYFATGKLNQAQAKSILSGIVKGCELSGSALVGGETAEMPGMYQGDDYDLAGFSVGIVEKTKIIDGSQVKAGDALIALASSGVHSNGFSLVRKVIETQQLSWQQKFADSTLGETLLTPTRIYVKSILNLLTQVSVHAMAHITGGGITENLPRVLPKHTRAIVDTHSWQRPEIFQFLQEASGTSDSDMFRTFNMGVGFIICVAQDQVSTALSLLQSTGETAWVMGEITQSSEEVATVSFK